MKIKVTIEFEDEFANEHIAVSGIDNLDPDVFDAHLEFITMYVINAITALGFEKENIKEYFRENV